MLYAPIFTRCIPKTFNIAILPLSPLPPFSTLHLPLHRITPSRGGGRSKPEADVVWELGESPMGCDVGEVRGREMHDDKGIKEVTIVKWKQKSNSRIIISNWKIWNTFNMKYICSTQFVIYLYVLWINFYNTYKCVTY